MTAENTLSDDALLAEIEKCLTGIDKTECECAEGWWETGTGAKFGKSKLEIIRGLFKNRDMTAEPTTACRCGKPDPCPPEMNFIKITMTLTPDVGWIVDILASSTALGGDWKPIFQKSWEPMSKNTSLDEVAAALPTLLKCIPR